MAVTLDPTLQTRMDSIDRQPVIEVQSTEYRTAIPYQGNSFGIAQTDTFRPHMLSLSSGRLVAFYIDGTSSTWDDIRMMVTDTGRSQWTPHTLAGLASHPEDVTSVSGTELADGNIGVVYLIDGRYLYNAVVSPTGSIVTARSLIEDLTASYDWVDIFVTTLNNDTYYMVYVKEDTVTPQYDIMKRTASTWGSWSADSAIALSGLNQSRHVGNPTLFHEPGGDLLMVFDYVTAIQDDVAIKNIFSCISTNNGASFGSPTSRTNYTYFGQQVMEPMIVQKSNGTFWLVFYERRGALHMDETTTGFVGSDTGDWCSLIDPGMGLKGLHVDSANRKILIGYGNSQMGHKPLCGMAVIDMDTWTIDKCYTTESTPALSTLFTSNIFIFDVRGDGKYFAAHTVGADHDVIVVLDHTIDSLTHYVIGNDNFTGAGGPINPWGVIAHNLPRNITITRGGPHAWQIPHIMNIRIDADEGRLYIGWAATYLYSPAVYFGYIDLTEAPDGEGWYSHTWLCDGNLLWPNSHRTQHEGGWDFVRDKARGYIILGAQGGSYVGWEQEDGIIVVYAQNSGCATVKILRFDTNNSMPLWGPRGGLIQYGNAIYFDFRYTASYPHTDKRGLCKVDYITDTISFYRPGFATVDQYTFYDSALNEADGYIYFACPWGVARFEISSGAFSLYDSNSVVGMVKSGESDAMGWVAYEPVRGDIVAGAWNDYITNYRSGITMFNDAGAYDQLQYITADKVLGAYNWGSQLDLSYYSQESQPTIALDVDDILWTIWTHADWANDQMILTWDNDAGAVNVSNDLVGSVVMKWQMKRLNSLNFRLANGYLYDPQNLLSTRSVVGQKGRKVTVRIGELIGGYKYWVNQGLWIVDTVSMSYERGADPILNINCTGQTGIWKDKEVDVTDLYSGATPDNVITDLIDTNTQWDSDDYNIPVFADEHGIFYQWIDKSLWDIIEELCDHFFYAMFEDADGVFRPRKVSLTQAVDHEYPTDMQIITYTPDDSFSDYTNRIVVMGESRDYMEIVHDEEMVTSRAGTVGWWVKKTTETIYFSEDQQRQCRQPRLDITHSPDEYGLLLDLVSSGDGKITLSIIDPFEKFIVVDITVPDLEAAFIGAVVAMVAMAVMAVGCDYGWGVSSNCGPFIMAVGILSSLVMYILGAVAQYQYDVWGRPLGKVKLTIQAIANDLEMQIRMNGEIVEKKITDPLCEFVSECQRVADGEMALVKAQRRRLDITKLAHLQDELLDKIKVYHPYSGEAMELLVVGLTRTYEKGGGVRDLIEGWRYIP